MGGTMKYMLITALLFISMGCAALDCTPFGPEASTLHCANFYTEPISMGGVFSGQEVLFLWENGVWNHYAYWTQGLPITGTCMLNESTLMSTLAGGSYSDGVYNLTLSTHEWALNEWFFWPHFVKHDPITNIFYVGERQGLYHSYDGDIWSRISTLGTNECTSLAMYGTYLVANSGAAVFNSLDSGQTWNQCGTSNLSSFRFTSSGALYAIMSVGSDSDGVWRSDDYGATWTAVYYATGLSCLGPEYAGYLVLGWNVPNEFGGYLALLSPQHTLLPLQHDTLNSPIKELDVFPLINTPSVYVINNLGCYYLTQFLPVDVADAVQVPLVRPQLHAYPNPASRTLQVDCLRQNADPAELYVYNLKGQVVRKLDILPTDQQLSATWNLQLQDGTRAPSGLYILAIKNQAGNIIASGRIMVVK